MATITVKDKHGKDIEIVIPDTVDPKSLGELTKTIASLKPKRASAKSSYGAITSIVGSDDKKFITFNTKADSFKYSFKDSCLIHCKTNEKFAASHVAQLTMNVLLGSAYDGGNTWALCAQKVTSVNSLWVKGLFLALERWSYGGCHFNDGMERRSKNNIRVFMEYSKVIQALEPYVKTEYTLDQIVNHLSDSFKHLMFIGKEIKPFSDLYKGGDKGIDDWITLHGNERVARSFYLEDSSGSRYRSHRVTSYEHLPEDALDKLSKYTREYIRAKNNGYDDLFRIFWENHRIPIADDSVGHALKNLVHNHNYDRVALASYICDSMPRQGISLNRNTFDTNFTNWLVDYVDMNKNMSIEDYDKYPRSIKLAHDVSMVNYDIRRMKIEDEKYVKAYTLAETYAYKPTAEKYMVVAPANVGMIIREGTLLHHCVASYVPRILQCETIVMFMREVDKPNDPLITLEVKNGVLVQAKAAHNKAPNPEQHKFLDNYKKHLKSLTVAS